MKRAHVSVVLLLALGLVFLGMAPAGAAQPAKPAIVDSSTWLLRSSLTGGKATTSFKYGRVGDIALMCDWNGNGNATAAVVREVNDSLVWHIRHRNAAGAADVSLTYGISTTSPCAVTGTATGGTRLALFEPTTRPVG